MDPSAVAALSGYSLSIIKTIRGLTRTEQKRKTETYAFVGLFFALDFLFVSNFSSSERVENR